MILTVKVIPNARKNEIVESRDGILKVRIHAPPDKGKANDELIAFLSEHFSVPKTKIHILSGHSSRLKKVQINEVASKTPCPRKIEDFEAC